MPFSTAALSIGVLGLLIVLLYYVRQARIKAQIQQQKEIQKQTDASSLQDPNSQQKTEPIIEQITGEKKESNNTEEFIDLSDFDLETVSEKKEIAQEKIAPKSSANSTIHEENPSHLIQENQTGINSKKQDIIDLVSRFKFFSGQNLETFSRLLKEDNYESLEQLLNERFTQQGKENPGRLAKEVLGKLIAPLQNS